MQPLEQLIVDAAFRSRVLAAVERLKTEQVGGVRVVASPSWRPFVDRLMLEEYDGASAQSSALVVGPPAAVLRHAETAAQPFGFVMPVARICKPWQRAKQWRDDATLDLWRSGWTPLALDRVLVAADDATCEFVIGTARQTPAVAEAST